MEKREAPQMVYKNGRPQGYRVGIGINGAYGICPFCGETYEQEDIDNGTVNFEHVYPRFAIKNAIKLVNRGDDKNKRSPEIEASVKVGVHKKCNSDGRELEDTIKLLVESINKGGQLTPEQGRKVLQYCRKTSVFLQYLIDYKGVPEPLVCFKENMTYCVAEVLAGNSVPNTIGYDNHNHFVLSVNGLLFLYRESSNKEDLSENLSDPYVLKGNLFSICMYKGKLHYVKRRYIQDKKGHVKHVHVDVLKFDKSIAWRINASVKKLGKPRFQHVLGNLPQIYSSYMPAYNITNPLLKLRLSLGGEFRRGIDEDVIFNQNGELYVYQNGIKKRFQDAEPYEDYWLNGLDIIKLPDMAKSRIKGSFFCHDNKLLTLTGAPYEVDGIFMCSYNCLKSLFGAPRTVGKHFNCSMNQLISLEGLPTIGGDLVCSNNKLRDLQGIQQKTIVGNFRCFNNELVSLSGAPEKINGTFDCGNNQLTSLECGLKVVGGDYICLGNKLTTLYGAPEYIGQDFVCGKNPLKTLKIPLTTIAGEFSFDVEHLESLDGLPMAKSYWIRDCKMVFDSADELRAWFAEYKKQRDGKKKMSDLRAGAKRVGALDSVQKTKRKTRPSNQNEK